MIQHDIDRHRISREESDRYALESQHRCERARREGRFLAAVQQEPELYRAYWTLGLLLGPRGGELRSLRWADVDFQWQKLTIADKVEATRVIPLTPYMAHLLAGLPRARLEIGRKWAWPLAFRRVAEFPTLDAATPHRGGA